MRKGSEGSDEGDPGKKGAQETRRGLMVVTILIKIILQPVSFRGRRGSWESVRKPQDIQPRRGPRVLSSRRVSTELSCGSFALMEAIKIMANRATTTATSPRPDTLGRGCKKLGSCFHCPSLALSPLIDGIEATPRFQDFVSRWIGIRCTGTKAFAKILWQMIWT